MSDSEELQQPTLGQFAEELTSTLQACQICGTSFKKHSHFNRHMRQRHTESRDYVCKEENCGKTFKRGSHLKRHMISHTNIKSYKCNHCVMSFGYKHHLDRHIKVVHLSERIQCTSCGLKFKKKKAYHKHIEKMHTVRASKELKKGISVDDSKAVDNTITKIGFEESMKNQDIYDSSSSDSEDYVKSQKLFYRCHYEACLSAFERLSDFKRHLTKLHQDQSEQ